jgi:hypothetical protein
MYEELARRVKLLESRIYFEKGIDEHLEQVENQDIDPESLLGLGFDEEYQEPEPGVPGFIYYTFSKHGLELVSSEVGGNEPFHVSNMYGYVICNFSKLKALVEALNELE